MWSNLVVNLRFNSCLQWNFVVFLCSSLNRSRSSQSSHRYDGYSSDTGAFDSRAFIDEVDYRRPLHVQTPHRPNERYHTITKATTVTNERPFVSVKRAHEQSKANNNIIGVSAVLFIKHNSTKSYDQIARFFTQNSVCKWAYTNILYRRICMHSIWVTILCTCSNVVISFNVNDVEFRYTSCFGKILFGMNSFLKTFRFHLRIVCSSFSSWMKIISLKNFANFTHFHLHLRSTFSF